MQKAIYPPYKMKRKETVKEVVEKAKITDDLVQNVVKRINQNAEKTKGWGKALKLCFTDIDVAYWIKLSMDGMVETVENGRPDQLTKKECAATLKMTSDTFAGLLKGSISPVSAFLKGDIKIDGSIGALMHLASAFGMG